MLGIPKTFGCREFDELVKKISEWFSAQSQIRITHISLSASADGTWEGHRQAYERLLLTVWYVQDSAAPPQRFFMCHSGKRPSGSRLSPEQFVDESIAGWLKAEKLNATVSASVAFGPKWDFVAVVAQ